MYIQLVLVILAHRKSAIAIFVLPLGACFAFYLAFRFRF